MAIEYNEKVLAHFLDPHNVGVLEDADGIGQLGDPACGDVFVMFIKVKDGRLADIKLHCSNLAATVLHQAIADYLTRRKADLRDWRAPYERYRSERETSP